MYSIWKLSKVYPPPLKNVNRIGCSNPQQAFGASFASRACYRPGDTPYVVGTPVKGVQAENVEDTFDIKIADPADYDSDREEAGKG